MYTKTNDLVSSSETIGESLALGDREHRIRRALLHANGPLPNVDTETLWRYFQHLTTKLSLPFQARCHEAVSITAVLVVHLVDPSRKTRKDSRGICCEIRMDEMTREVPIADLEVEEESANFQPLDDYWYWFWNWQ